MNKSCNISFFEAKIAEKQLYIESLKDAVQKGGDLTSWCNGFIENMDDLLDVLIFCKNKFHKKENEVDSPAPTLPSHTPIVSPASSSSLSTRALPYRAAYPPASSSSSENCGAPSDPRSSVDYMAIREEENRCSILVMNLPECDAFDPSEKRASDFAHVKVMLKCSGVSADVKSILRFSPKFLEAGRPPFLKVNFTSEEEKKKALFVLIGSIRRIRALDNKYVNVAVTDCDKSGKDNVSSNFTRLNPSSPFQRNNTSPTSDPINSSSPSKFGARYNSSSAFKNDSSPRNRINAPTVSDRVNSSSTSFLPRNNTATTISRFNSSPAYNRANTSPDSDADIPSSPSSDHNAIVPPTKTRVRKMFASATSRSSSLGPTRFTKGDKSGFYSSDDEEK